MRFIKIGVLFMTPFAAVAQNPAAITYPDLVERVYNLEHLATPPSRGEASGTFTSYDRNARYDEKTNTYINWEANDDGRGFIRKEEGGYVVFENNGLA